MKINYQKLSLTLVIITLPVLAIPMDMSMTDDDDDNSIPSLISDSIDYSTVIPVAHEMKHKHGVPILETNGLTPAERKYWENYNTTTFFTIEEGNKPALYYHIVTILTIFTVFYPISLVLNNIKSLWYIPFLTVYNGILISSLISLKIYSNSISHLNLYPNNAYSPMSFILLIFSLIHYFSAVLLKTFKWIKQDYSSLNEEYPVNKDEANFIPLDDFDLEANTSRSPTLYESNSSFKNSNEGKQVKFDNSLTHNDNHTYKDSLDLNGSHEYSDQISTHSQLPSHRNSDDLLSNKIQHSLNHSSFVYKLFSNSYIQTFATKFHFLSSIIFNCLNYPMFGYLFIYFMTGITVSTLLGKDNHVFNLLAHFIKGGVFILIGLLSLARYCGCLSKNGLAWNKALVFKNQISSNSWFFKYYPHGMITMEGLESFLIFFYGSTNIFLEHLASPGGAWSAKDLQHASIAFMYIGSGLCGLITEYILSEWRFNQVMRNTKIHSDAIHAGSPGYSPNPFPVFTIFWTGILMSAHEQASKTSTTIHEQWGYLLAYGSFFRLLTFALLMLVPNKNLNPARPFTELITSFCLIAGGAIFMQSNDEVVQALEYRGLTSMFTLNVNVGIVTLVMGWEMLLLIWKFRLQKNNQI
ncbi:hypothetical protein WICMUC_002042 [Wickerhamomyces mucosus]|uniref:Protein YTP1-like C-terminal domain-containing protein n=1 Tax=Wickerhamomyces mucosus TaxID=1378264 RepID=A0A9P8TEZ1_9ASCO|nr:hypothetical protein WICMUC_002042 [Wickerhamomyces mucosus]